jgi:hypothetical protein
VLTCRDSPRRGEASSCWFQHRDRPRNMEDFETITLRPGCGYWRRATPSIQSELPLDEPGNAAGAVTLMVIPKFDHQPRRARPDPMFINAICDWLDSRRLNDRTLRARPNLRAGLDLGRDQCCRRKRFRHRARSCRRPYPPLPCTIAHRR